MHNVTFDERLSSEAQGLKEQALDTRQCPLMIQSGHFKPKKFHVQKWLEVDW
jgi:hypothetical protein